MIKTTIIALIEGRRYEFTSELAEVAGWADTAEETAIGLLHDGMDQLARAIEREPWPTQVTDENGNRQCYLCGFFHDEPGSCANGTPTNITPGPDDEPEYDGPTDDDSDRFLAAGNDDGWDGPESGDYIEPREPDWPEEGDYSPVQIMPPYVDKELQAKRCFECDELGALCPGHAAERYGESVIAVDPAMHPDSKIPPLVTSLNTLADTIRARIGRSVVEASKRDEADQ